MQICKTQEDKSPYDRAQEGLSLIEGAIVSLLTQHEQGLSNAEIAAALKLETRGLRGQRNYLTWSILKKLESEGRISSFPSSLRKTGVLYSLSKGASL